MDFLENVKNVVGNAAQSVVKKSGEVVEYSKIKYSIFDIESTIKDLECQIGKAIYESYKENTSLDESIKDKCAEIDKLSEQIDIYAEQLGNIKSSVKCPICDKNVKEECSYCPYCGAKLATDVDAHFESSSNEYCSTDSEDNNISESKQEESTDDESNIEE